MRMRLPGLAAAMVLLSLLPVPALAQDSTATIVLEEGAGDVRLSGPAPVTAPSGQWRNLDLRSLTVDETLTTLEVTLGVDALVVGPEQVLFGNRYRVAFELAGQTFAVDAIAFQQGNGLVSQGSLHTFEADEDPLRDYGYWLGDVAVQVDAAANSFRYAVPRDLLVDATGATPFPGREVTGFRAATSYLDFFGNIAINGQAVYGPELADRMPDDGAGQEPYVVRLGIQQTGDLRLASPEPFRASNGEAATFVFHVAASNLGEEAILAEFVANGVPGGWTVRTPGLARLEAGETIEVPVLVQTTFTHEHGAASAFLLELLGQDDARSVGRVQLGLRYPAIAQPSGHHPNVYLHTQSFRGDPLTDALYLGFSALVGQDVSTLPYFNTALPEEDPNDAGLPADGSTCEVLRFQDDNDTVGTSYCWQLPLLPGLEMGLDVDLDAVGTYSIPVRTTAPQPGLRLAGVLEYYPPEATEDFPGQFQFFFGDPVPVAHLQWSERVELGVTGTATLTGLIVPDPDADLIPYERGGQLLLRLEARTARPDNFFLGPKTQPSLAPGGVLTLPLLDYSDPVQSADAYGSLHVVVAGESERMTNPGKTVSYGVTVHNAGNATDDVRLTLIGANLAWATLQGPERVRLSAGEAVEVRILVQVPPDALDGDRADLVLEAASLSDVASRALVRLVAVADTDQEHAEETVADAEPARGSPGPGVGLAALALAALALRRRRA